MRANRGSLGDPTLNTDRQRGGSYEHPPPHPQLWPQGTRLQHLSCQTWLAAPPPPEDFAGQRRLCKKGVLSLGPLYYTLGIRDLGS